MSRWPSVKASRLLAALLRIGWTVKRQAGSHKTLSRSGWPDLVFAFHDTDEIGPKMLARLSKNSGLKPEDL
ncbi:type II toxin-antitoxin system HicA family toxin [Desulfosarcina sp. OttesenSCG-928-G10]|nr:type II toxin-antitoxin system HicA family toxin [Desulfosarcina sp. OttesenSCG-928-G10]